MSSGNLPWVFRLIPQHWVSSGGQVTAHLLMASSFLPLSYSISSMKLAQPPVPSYEQHVSCSSRPCLNLTSAAILIGYNLFPHETAMPAIFCLYTPELKAEWYFKAFLSWASSKLSSHCKVSSIDLSVRPSPRTQTSQWQSSISCTGSGTRRSLGHLSAP